MYNIHLNGKEVIHMIRQAKRALYSWFYNLLLSTLKVAVLVGIGIAIGISLR